MPISRRTSSLLSAFVGTVAAVALVLGGSLSASAEDADTSPRATDSASGIQAQAAAQATLQQSLAAAHAPAATSGASKNEAGSQSTQAQTDSTASAAALAFSAGNIINDSLFYTGTALTTAQVQTFLNQKGSGCTAGSLCLKNYKQTTYTQAADQMCGKYVGAANETAATIVYRVGKLCGISQKVLLTLIQKESSLVAATNPTAGDYETATGYGCADTQATCDKYYYGFYNQVYNAAWQFKRYLNPPGRTMDFTYFPVGKATSIQYNYDTSCGSSKVTLKNAATAALYYYTPYQPNKAALANPYGSGDACSSYGNRNFFVVYRDWFGSPNTAPDQYFSDVPVSSAKYPDIQFLARLGIANSVTAADGSQVFYPAKQANKSTVATYLYKYYGLPFVPPTTPSFADISVGNAAFTAVEWMKSRGLASPDASGNFNPNAIVNRQDLAVILATFSGDTLPNPATPSFTDVPKSNPAYRSIEWMKAHQVVGGTTFGPTTPLTRQSLADYLYGYYNRV
ncbi:S-layer homology domain-containing protein [Subtercola boreus]|uniref:S-layer homology domain-containing protein n=1 Tax=Subtercola boreus TaxID=120213 RepID=UPI0014734562|nr:S-layer homology domain-containing protein [Subtercola boreus]